MLLATNQYGEKRRSQKMTNNGICYEMQEIIGVNMKGSCCLCCHRRLLGVPTFPLRSWHLSFGVKAAYQEDYLEFDSRRERWNKTR